MAPQLLTLPNEILIETIRHLVPEFDPKDESKGDKGWRSSPHHNVLRNVMLTCKHLYTIARPYLYAIIVLDYHTNMTHFLRTLIENPDLRGLVQTLSIQCPLYFCDTIVDPYSPRETFLDDNPELKRKLDMKWDTGEMDEFAAKVFTTVGLDADAFKEFTEDELEALNENSYWMAIPTWSERVGYENALMQGMALALICLSTRLERLCLWNFYDMWITPHLERGVSGLVRDEALKDRILVGLKRLEIWSVDGCDASGYFNDLFEIPAVKELVEQGDHRLEREQMELWVAK
ncbi:hypothetical protein TWF718_008394 [Orbilia javanica]|uniref:Uncharacterized protein n=1 Tax=Orbilia javanica TaxID=47235 RepID=A0AAN8RHA8_9PEZI